MAVKPPLPRVFVGSAYGKPFNFNKFQTALNDIPFRFVYAKDTLRTKHLLANCYELIERADFCLFDVSTWNANVTLELGLAEGLGIDYYILCKRNPAKGVPADITGIQRIEYTAYNQCATSDGGVLKHGLWYRVAEQLVPKNPLLRKLWQTLGRFDKPNRLRLFAFRILSELRGQGSLTIKRAVTLSAGTRLQESDRLRVLTVMRRQGLITMSTRAVRPARSLFSAA
jgi:hypothetical protein